MGMQKVFDSCCKHRLEVASGSEINCSHNFAHVEVKIDHLQEVRSFYSRRAVVCISTALIALVNLRCFEWIVFMIPE